MAKAEFLLHQNKNPQGDSNIGNWPKCYPGSSMKWTDPGDINIQGTKWSSDSHLSMGGDPVAGKATISLNTGANHDCNALWSCDKSDATERLVRGIHFKTWTNAAKFRPRISGAALQYKNANTGSVKYFGLNYRETWYTSYGDGSLGYEGTDQNHHFTAVGAPWANDGSPFHNKDFVLSGVLFHYETTFKTGSAIWCETYVKDLRFITDGNTNANPTYNNKYRVWGWRVK